MKKSNQCNYNYRDFYAQLHKLLGALERGIANIETANAEFAREEQRKRHAQEERRRREAEVRDVRRRQEEVSRTRRHERSTSSAFR
ncbi:hypothetical protein GPALN_005850 [Globodera pallida]|nr:hypothetical protein GPALN_005850 [Globodera pallida]